ncbi:MAG: ATP-binding protein [Elusimicrobiota bacterium]
MKQLLIISGKGGTGKTTLTAALAGLYEDIVVADCDVDAPDLHILLEPRIKDTEVFKGGKLAKINKDICSQCGMCRQLCQFSAIDKDFNIDPVSCEGCCVCSWNCPNKAINMVQKESGESYISSVSCGVMVHALLKPGEENSGKLVAQVKNKAKALAEKDNSSLLLVDGPPGIGCPVIASLSGVDLALVVTEPTKSGIHDMERVIKVAQHFGVALKAVINKFDLNMENNRVIEKKLLKNDIEILEKIPYSKKFSESVKLKKTIIEYEPASQESECVRKIKDKINASM